jgi:hypothetical protein
MFATIIVASVAASLMSVAVLEVTDTVVDLRRAEASN